MKRLAATLLTGAALMLVSATTAAARPVSAAKATAICRSLERGPIPAAIQQAIEKRFGRSSNLQLESCSGGGSEGIHATYSHAGSNHAAAGCAYEVTVILTSLPGEWTLGKYTC